MKKFTVAAIIAACLATPSLAQDLHLLCTGSGTAAKTDTIFTQEEDSRGRTSTATSTIDTPRDFAGETTVDIVGGEGRIRLPRIFLPDLHGGNDGWFELRDLVVGDNAITAKAALSIFDRPQVRLDRRTGSIAIDGNVGSYSGRCHPYDPDSQKRAF